MSLDKSLWAAWFGPQLSGLALGLAKAFWAAWFGPQVNDFTVQFFLSCLLWRASPVLYNPGRYGPSGLAPKSTFYFGPAPKPISLQSGSLWAVWFGPQVHFPTVQVALGRLPCPYKSILPRSISLGAAW